MKVRRHLITFALFLGILAGSALAFGDFSLRPLARWFADDRTIGFGNTAAAPDVSCGWETTGAEDHLACVIPSGAGLLVSSDADVDRSGVVAPGATYLGACSDDAGFPTECVTARHNGTDAIVETHSGNTLVYSAGGTAEFGDGVGSEGFRVRAGATSVAEILVNAGGDGYIVANHGNLDQAVIAVGSTAGTQVVLTTTSSYTLDHDHANQTNPTLFGHSATNPDTSNVEWWALTHDQTDAWFWWGAGVARFDGTATDTVSVGPDGNDVDVAAAGTGISYSGTARPTHDFFLSPQQFLATNGAPAIAAYNGRPAMAFDGATDETARAVWMLPACYADETSITVTLYLSAGASATRDVVIGTQFHAVSDSEQLVAGGITENTLTTYTVDIADDLDVAAHANFNILGTGILGGDSLMLGVRRNADAVAGGAADTLDGVDLQFLGVRLTLTVDSEC